MKTKRRSTWIIRYYDAIEGVTTYRTYADVTIDEVNWFAYIFLKYTLSAEPDDLRGLISDSLFKLSQYNTRDEQFKIEYIDSSVHLQEPEKIVPRVDLVHLNTGLLLIILLTI